MEKLSRIVLSFSLALSLFLVPAVGCVTTRTPDGSQTTSMDVPATIAVMESTLALLQQGYAMYLERMEHADIVEQLRLEREAEAQQERIRLVQETLMALYRRASADVDPAQVEK